MGECVAFVVGAVLCHLLKLTGLTALLAAAAAVAGFGAYRSLREIRAANAAATRYLARTLNSWRSDRPVDMLHSRPLMRNIVEEDGEDYLMG